ncbi:MAG: amidohydrolase [Eubacteriales bacterium]|nr:amidohydrolase [Eubacteriales bacterium]
MSYKDFTKYVEKHREKILEVERYVWQHPETGFREWNTSKYLAKIFEDAGYELTYAGDIPGFYTDIDTGRPGPKVLVFGELDALLSPNHEEQVNGCAHACGHNTQVAALVGISLALKEPGALDGLSGSIRLCAVPAEELIEIEYRDSLRKQGIIHYLGGKVEYMYRGYFDDVDMAFMNHIASAPEPTFYVNDANGCVAKTITYTGMAAHAGGAPHNGINAMYAAVQGINAINALRETFEDEDHVRVHPIITAGGSSVNIIPAVAKLQSYVRGATLDCIKKNNIKVNRALAAGALGLGAEVVVEDRPGYAPLYYDHNLGNLMMEVAREIIPAENVKVSQFGKGSTDMGDIAAVMPAVHAHISGSTGKCHGDEFKITDPETACVKSASVYMMTLRALLENDAEKAREIKANAKPQFESIRAYFEAVDYFMADRDMVKYTENGAEVNFK